MRNHKFNKYRIGKYYYTFNEHREPIVLRVKKQYKNDVYSLYNRNHPDVTFLMDGETIDRYYRSIKPSMTLAFVSCECKITEDLISTYLTPMQFEKDTFKDIIVIAYKYDEFSYPYTIARVMIDGGLLVSQDWDQECQDLLHYEKILNYSVVHYYKQDTPHEVFQLMNPETLRYQNELIRKVYGEGPRSSLKNMLYEMCFWDEIDRINNIESTDLILTEDDLNENETNILSEQAGFKILFPFLVKYDMDIDESKIKTKYKLLRDATNEIYLLSYSKGRKIRNATDRWNLNLLDDMMQAINPDTVAAPF